MVTTVVQHSRVCPNAVTKRTGGGRNVMTTVFILLVAAVNQFVLLHGARIVYPKIPDVLHPPVPDDFNFDNVLTQSDQDPEVMPGLFQGDMAIDNLMYKYWRVGLRWDIFPEKRWPNGTVPYAISPLYEPSDYVTIYKAIRTIAFMTCVKFVKWNGVDKDFLLIWPIKYPKGCWSYVGKTGGTQILSLQPPDNNGPNCLGSEGRAIHEIMHALGIFHEQSRTDRDRFVKINWSNILPSFKGNFDKQSLENTTYTFEYDYDSIMHYGRTYFARNKTEDTIVPKIAGSKIGQRRAMSKTDCLKLNEMYKCFDNPRLNRKYYTICRTLGL